MTATLAPPTQTPSEAPSNGSLKPVIDIIPDAAYDNPTWKGLAYFGRDLVVYGLVVWGLIVVTNPFAILALRSWPPWSSRRSSSWPTTAPTAPCSAPSG